MDSIQAINTLAILKAQKQSELDAVNLAISILDGTFAGQYAELENAKGQIDALTGQLTTLMAAPLIDAAAPAIAP